MSTLVLTVIGDDRPGLVKTLAEVVAAQQGNWQRSQLAQLAGQFAGLVEVEVDQSHAEDLVAALQQLDGLEVMVRGGAAASSVGARQFRLELVGNDRPGIVAEITSALASHRVNIEQLDTATREAPMAGGTLFVASAVLSAPADADLGEISSALEQLADELMVELSVVEAD